MIYDICSAYILKYSNFSFPFHNFLLKKEKPLTYIVNENEKEFVHA